MGDTTRTFRPPKSRLQEIDQSSRRLRPWLPAEQLTRCSLYWLPVRSSPMPSGEKSWLMAFIDRLSVVLCDGHKLRVETFLQYKTIYPDLLDPFLLHAPDLLPVLGLFRSPGQNLPKPPSQDQLDALASKKKAWDFNEWVADYSMWFVEKSAQLQRELFLGYGGLTILFMKPDSKTAPPKLPDFLLKNPAFQGRDVEKLLAKGSALTDGFQEKSRELFGVGLEKDPQFRGLRFIFPMLRVAEFFSAPVEEFEKWWQVFEVFLAESPADQGMLLATRLDLDDEVAGILEQMRIDGLHYPGGDR